MTEGRHLQPLEGISSHMLGKIQGTKREVTGAGDVKKGVTSPSWNQHCSEVQSRHGTAQKQQAVNRCQRTRHFGHEETQDLQVIVVTVAVQPPVKLLYVLFIYIYMIWSCSYKLGRWNYPFLVCKVGEIWFRTHVLYEDFGWLGNPSSWGKTPEDWWSRGGRRRGAFCWFGGKLLDIVNL